MPIDLGNLDDKSYQDLEAEARASITIHDPTWTDHNPSDPGIALVELFAWLTEMLLYRANRVTAPSYGAFLKLLGGASGASGSSGASSGAPLDEALRRTIKDLRETWRAVTTEDYERLTLDAASASAWLASPQAASLGVAARFRRVRCVSPTPPHVGVVVVPDVPDAMVPAGEPKAQWKHDHPWCAPEPRVLSALVDFFDDRRLITTRVYATGVRYVPITLSAKLYLRNDARVSDFPAAAAQAIAAYFHPWDGGPDGRGWPFGRAVHASEAYAVLEKVSGIDFMEELDLQVSGADAARRIGSGGEVVMIRLEPHELPRVDGFSFTLMERRSTTWQPIAL